MGGLGASPILQRFIDNSHSRVGLKQHVVVPETKHSVALRFEKASTRIVFGDPIRLGVTAAVEFDDQLALMTGKIRIIRTDRCLAPEVRALRS